MTSSKRKTRISARRVAEIIGCSEKTIYNGGAGTETLRLDVTLSERPKNDGPLALGFEAPSPGNPGRAYFQLASGRFVEAKVAIERN